MLFCLKLVSTGVVYLKNIVMKTSIKTISLLASAALFTLNSFANVQTDPVGYTTIVVPDGGSILAPSLYQEPVYSGVVDGVDGQDIDLPNLPSLSGSLFLHVTSSDNALGQVRTITAVDGGTASVESLIAGLANGDTVSIRPHFLLSDLDSLFEFSDDDTVTVYNLDGSSNSYSYFDGFGFFDLESETDGNSVIVFPGEGISLNVATGGSIVLTGAVMTYPIAVQAAPNVPIYVGNSDPSSAISLEDLLVLQDDDTVTLYKRNPQGQLVTDASYAYFSGFGFFNLDDETEGNDILVPVGSAVVVVKGNSQDVVLQSPVAVASE